MWMHRRENICRQILPRMQMVIAINRHKGTLNIFSINDVIIGHYYCINPFGWALKCSQSYTASHVHLAQLLASVHIWNPSLFPECSQSLTAHVYLTLFLPGVHIRNLHLCSQNVSKALTSYVYLTKLLASVHIWNLHLCSQTVPKA